ncbi:MAG: diguanylate cyclase [Candidatus Aminicenantes bacterium]|nr:diguanylate cyclase [Candidatus Aminicenantes bacterium]
MAGKPMTAIACSVFKPELEDLAARNALPEFSIRFFDSCLHMNPSGLQETLGKLIDEERGFGSRILVLLGDCAADTAALAEGPDIVRIAGANCGEMFLGKEEHKALVKDGAFLLFPEWLDRWREILLRFPGLDADLSRSMIRDMHSRFVYLDTGVRPVPGETLKECGEYFGLPVDILEVGLDLFVKEVHAAVGRFAAAQSAPTPDAEAATSSTERDRQATAVMVLDIITAVLKNPGDLSDTARRLSQKIRELTGARLVILAALDPAGESSSPRILDVNPSRHEKLLESDLLRWAIAKSLTIKQTTLLSNPTEEQKEAMRALGLQFCPCLTIPLFSGRERIGAILSLGLMDTAFVGSFMEIEEVLSGAISAILKSALLREERKKIIDELAHDKQRLESILEGTNIGTWEWNVQTGETIFNERWAEMIGYTLADLQPMSIETWKKHLFPEDAAVSEKALSMHFSGEFPFYDCEVRMIHRNGMLVWVHDRGKVRSWTADRKPLMMYGTHEDITGRKMYEERIRHLATHDALTGLPGLRLANERLDWSLSLARRNRNLAAVMFIDLDGFKSVNDRLGHEAGDFVLKTVALRIQSCIRETDTLARVGGDEFFLIATSLNTPSDAAEIARKAIQEASRPILIDGKEAVVGLSVGIALYPNDSQDKDDLIRLADTAMYKVKASGKNSFGFAGK